MAKKLIIAAHSARGFAQAATDCGYTVITLDAFADADTQAFSTQNFKLKFNDFVLDAADFKRLFVEMALNIDLGEVEGFLYGSLFDNCPDLLAWAAARVRLLGNTPDAMQAAKSFTFFKLLDDLGISHPEVLIDDKNHQPSFPSRRESNLTLKTQSKKMDSRLHGNDEIIKNGEDWLSKRLGGTGGSHVKPAENASAGDYLQRKIEGKPISMLFVADGKLAKTIGFNEQFIAPTAQLPYRFAGAVSGIKLAPNIHEAFEHAAQQLTSALNLRGINSLDAVLEGENLWILELNPRLSATFHLYPNLLPAHIQGCAGDLVRFSMHANSSKAQWILYADDALEIAADFVWPSWVADIPAVDTTKFSVKIEKNMPICTVLAQALNAELAHELVLKHAEKLREMLR